MGNTMHIEHALGLNQRSENSEEERKKLHLSIKLKLALCGQPVERRDESAEFLQIANDMILRHHEMRRQLSSQLCPVDGRIQAFLDKYLGGLDMDVPKLPSETFELDRHGISRELSFPEGENEFISDIVSSYRVAQGVLHNPANDRRTTKGSFHIAEGGLPIPGDKLRVPRKTAALMLKSALAPPDDLLTVPFFSKQSTPARMFVSLMLRPIVCPEIPGVEPEKTMEIRFFAPGTLVSNLDFVESIFGNGGNPMLPEFDSALDVEHWTGHTGCVILAPQLTKLTKKQLLLPSWDEASEEQQESGMCWKNPDEHYNDGQAFKMTMRDEAGVIVTLISDNYFGYCKKEVKTQIGYSANLYGLAEEEHSGGALAFRCRNHGEEYGAGSKTRNPDYKFTEIVAQYGELMDLKPEGYAIDKQFPEVTYIPQRVRINLNAQKISWQKGKGEKVQSIRLQPGKIYIQPNGYKIEMTKHPGAPSWRIVGTEPEGTFCHKPSTVSGGGKSEISKSIQDAMIYEPLFVNNLEKDLDYVRTIFDKDYTTRFRPGFENEDRDSTRQPLSFERSLGSCIKLLSPSPSQTEEYNNWVESIPPRILALAFLIKRFYRPEWGEDWQQHLSVDVVDGEPGNELKLDGRNIIGSYLRVGFDASGSWRRFKVRQDYLATEKIQTEDDISASVVVPRAVIAKYGPAKGDSPSVKLVTNCEYRLFQRPDDAIIPGYDKQAESDLSQPDNFIANYEPLAGDKLAAIVDDVITFTSYTTPMQTLLSKAYEEKQGYVVSTGHPRIVDGKPSKNPRYLQTRPDLTNPVRKYIADLGARLHRKIPLEMPVSYPVDAVLAGRRNNPSEPGIRALAVYNPIHYQELPELFMDFISSLTGKSPSTTGAGSEGALTKGPFNALRATPDLNNALVSFILTSYPGFSSSAGHIGPNVKVAHDVSLLIPEIWARLEIEERDPEYLLEHGYLEAICDIDYQGQIVLASRLGYRITDRFVHGFLGKIFDNPNAVFTEDILKPETQNMEEYVDGINNIVETQQRVAQRYLDDGSVEDACPPLQALLNIMAKGDYKGQDVHHPEIRTMFTRDYLLASDWYQERLEIKQKRDIALWQRHLQNLNDFINLSTHTEVAERLMIDERLQMTHEKLEQVQSAAYLESLVGTLGADPLKPARLN